MSSGDEQLAALAARFGVEYPVPKSQLERIATAMRVGSDESGASAESTPMRPAQAALADLSAASPPAMDDSVSLADSDLDVTERGLHKALAVAQNENRSLRKQLAALHEREVQIVALSIKAQDDFASAQQQLTQLKQRLSSELQHPVSEEQYRAVLDKPEHDRDLVDHIRVVIFDRLHTNASARTAAEQRAEQLAETVRSHEATIKRMEAEKTASDAEASREITMLRSNVEVLQQRVETADEIARRSAQTIDVNQAKAARCDAAETERDQLQSKYTHERDNAATYEAKYRQTTAELTGVRDELQRAQVLLHSAQAEVTFLSRERDVLATRCKDNDHRVSTLETALTEAQTQRVETSHNALNEREQLRSMFERQMETELKRYREQYAEDLQRMRDATREASERELGAARDARDNESLELTRVRSELEEAKSALETLRQASGAKSEELQVTVYDLRMQLATKSNESVRLDLQLREAEALKDKLKIDAECAQRKLDILKEEFYELKSSHREEVNALGAKLAAQAEQLELLREMEVEAEVYLANVARSGADPVESAAALSSIPASRRVTNAVTVTRKALALENELELARRDKGAAEAQLEKVQAELRMAKDVLRSQNSPYALMEESLNRKDAEINRLQQIENILKAQNEALEERLRVAQEDVRVLQTHRSELVRIKQYLQQLHQQQPSFPPGPSSTIVEPSSSRPMSVAQERTSRSHHPAGLNDDSPAAAGVATQQSRTALGDVGTQRRPAQSALRGSTSKQGSARVFVGDAIEL